MVSQSVNTGVLFISSFKLRPHSRNDARNVYVLYSHQDLPCCEDSNKLDEEERPELVAAKDSDPLSDVVWLTGPHPCLSEYPSQLPPSQPV